MDEWTREEALLLSRIVNITTTDFASIDHTKSRGWHVVISHGGNVSVRLFGLMDVLRYCGFGRK